jgi:hypothetical protein
VKRRWLLLLIAANLLVLVALAFIYPQLMVSPGALASAHAELTTDCFACHAPLRGAAPDRCIGCHAVADIGMRTTKGVGIANASVKSSFHQELAEQNCMACHSDHAGPKLTQRSRKPFSHALLRVTIRDRCETCHAPPKNDIHRNQSVGCGQCHKPDGWKPASFDHLTLPKAELSLCETCHKPPTDTLHRQIKGTCAQCHSPQGWKPATFEHDKLFLLDRDHNASCVTCHKGNDYSRYTCYGCHEHTPDNVARKHQKEGIRDFENCVACHRSATGESEGHGDRAGRKRD